MWSIPEFLNPASGRRFGRFARRDTLGAIGGVVAPPLLVSASLALTVIDHQFLDESGWSAVHRSEVEWPSLLMLGPNGALLVGAFAAAGVMVAGLGAARWRLVADPPMRAAAALLVAAGVALCLVAFPPDSPSFVGASTWHDRIHNSAYPVIPLAGLLAVGLVAAGAQRLPRSRWLTRASLAALAIAVPGFALTFTDSVAQLGRFFLFGSLLIWIEALAIATLAEALRERSDQGPR